MDTPCASALGANSIAHLVRCVSRMLNIDVLQLAQTFYAPVEVCDVCRRAPI